MRHVKIYTYLSILVVVNALGVNLTSAHDCTKHGPIKNTSHVYTAGNTKFYIDIYANGPGFTYFLPHDNEKTAVVATRKIIEEYGGKMVVFRHTGKRNFSFTDAGVKYIFDPNRIFTDNGIRASLNKLGGTYSQKAHQITKNIAQLFIKQLDDKAIIAVHNNTEARYSVLSYAKGAVYEKDAAKVHVNPNMDPDDFYFVTTNVVYESLSTKKYNVVLQNNASVTDDGSLSVYAAKKKLPYVNVEAQHQHTDMQTKMLKALVTLYK